MQLRAQIADEDEKAMFVKKKNEPFFKVKSIEPDMTEILSFYKIKSILPNSTSHSASSAAKKQTPLTAIETFKSKLNAIEAGEDPSKIGGVNEEQTKEL